MYACRDRRYCSWRAYGTRARDCCSTRIQRGEERREKERDSDYYLCRVLVGVRGVVEPVAVQILGGVR